MLFAKIPPRYSHPICCLPSKPLRYGEAPFAVWKEGWIVRAVAEGGAVGRFYSVPLLIKKAETAPKFPVMRAYPPRGYETALTRFLSQSSLCNNLELWNLAELLW